MIELSTVSVTDSPTNASAYWVSRFPAATFVSLHDTTVGEVSKTAESTTRAVGWLIHASKLLTNAEEHPSSDGEPHGRPIILRTLTSSNRQWSSKVDTGTGRTSDGSRRNLLELGGEVWSFRSGTPAEQHRIGPRLLQK